MSDALERFNWLVEHKIKSDFTSIGTQGAIDIVRDALSSKGARVTQSDMSQWWNDSFGNVRVMTVCEGYVMARRPRAMPFTKSMADFKNTFKEGKKI